MNEKQYLISESELKELIVHHSVYQDNVINDFLDTKQPAKTLNREEVEKIIRKKFGLTWMNPDGTVLQMIPETSFQEAITAICNLVPEGFELVASGKINYWSGKGAIFSTKDIDYELPKFIPFEQGKSFDIYIKERKE